jgi:hypothetical protein
MGERPAEDLQALLSSPHPGQPVVYKSHAEIGQFRGSGETATRGDGLGEMVLAGLKIACLSA